MAMVITSFFISVYYNVVIAWSLLYLYHSFASEVPWKSCGNGWNTGFCRLGCGHLNAQFPKDGAHTRANSRLARAHASPKNPHTSRNARNEMRALILGTSPSISCQVKC